MRTWLDYLGENVSDMTKIYDADAMFGQTTHPHVGSGRELHVVHYPVALYHKPTDVNPPPPRKRNRGLQGKCGDESKVQVPLSEPP